MKVGVIDYSAGNVYSVIHAIMRLGHEVVFTDQIERLDECDALVFPGQGEASVAMEHLCSRGLDRYIKETKKPLLGICIGMQLLCNHSEENDTLCLGVFDVPVVRFTPGERNEKVPHMGWNSLDRVEETQFPLSIAGEYVYFVHSYYVPLCDWTSAVTDYVQPFSSALHRDNYYAVQFHPEKSARIGEEILRNFFLTVEKN